MKHCRLCLIYYVLIRQSTNEVDYLFGSTRKKDISYTAIATQSSRVYYCNAKSVTNVTLGDTSLYVSDLGFFFCQRIIIQILKLFKI